MVRIKCEIRSFARASDTIPFRDIRTSPSCKPALNSKQASGGGWNRNELFIYTWEKIYQWWVISVRIALNINCIVYLAAALSGKTSFTIMVPKLALSSFTVLRIKSSGSSRCLLKRIVLWYRSSCKGRNQSLFKQKYNEEIGKHAQINNQLTGISSSNSTLLSASRSIGSGFRLVISVNSLLCKKLYWPNTLKCIHQIWIPF